MIRARSQVTRCQACDVHLDIDQATGFARCINARCNEHGLTHPAQPGLVLYSCRARYRRIKARRAIEERNAPV